MDHLQCPIIEKNDFTNARECWTLLARDVTPYNIDSDSRPRNVEPGFRTLCTVSLSHLGEEQTWDFCLALFPTYLAFGSSFFYPVGVILHQRT